MSPKDFKHDAYDGVTGSLTSSANVGMIYPAPKQKDTTTTKFLANNSYLPAWCIEHPTALSIFMKI